MSRRHDDEKRRRRSRIIPGLLLGMVFLYGGWCAILYLVQTGLVFPIDLIATTPGDPWDSRTVELTATSDSDGAGIAWLLPAGDGADSEPRPTLVLFHGNAELIDGQRDVATHWQRRGWNVLLIEYRGYGHASGSPSEAAIVADSLDLIRQATQHDVVDQDRLVYHGRSLGGAIAVQVADTILPRGLILESSFTHLGAFSAQYGVPSFLLKNPFETRDVLPSLECPILMFHGALDTIIPPEHSRALHELRPDATLVVLEGAGHNTMPGEDNLELFWGTIDEFVTGLDL